MGAITSQALEAFLQRLGERSSCTGTFYLLGGSALCVVGRYGRLDVYLFDLYSIALSKIARGFETDLDDVMFLLRERHIKFGELEAHFNAILPDAPKADVLPSEFRGYFEEVRRRFGTEVT
jgi:hypothetical protein